MYVYMILIMSKEESNKVASKHKHGFKINTRLLQQTKPCFKINSQIKSCLKTKCFQDMQGFDNRLLGSVMDY